MAKASAGCVLFLVYRDFFNNIKAVWAGIAGENGIKPDTWYALSETGEPIEVYA